MASARSLLLALPTVLALRVCVTTEDGFNMHSKPAAEATRESDFTGFDSEMRMLVLDEATFGQYTIEVLGSDHTRRTATPCTFPSAHCGGHAPCVAQVLGSYGEVHVKTRSGYCDIGWTNFYMTQSREECKPDANSDTCKPLPSDLSTITDWQPPDPAHGALPTPCIFHEVYC